MSEAGPSAPRALRLPFGTAPPPFFPHLPEMWRHDPPSGDASMALAPEMHTHGTPSGDASKPAAPRNIVKADPGEVDCEDRGAPHSIGLDRRFAVDRQLALHPQLTPDRQIAHYHELAPNHHLALGLVPFSRQDTRARLGCINAPKAETDAIEEDDMGQAPSDACEPSIEHTTQTFKHDNQCPDQSLGLNPPSVAKKDSTEPLATDDAYTEPVRALQDGQEPSSLPIEPLDRPLPKPLTCERQKKRCLCPAYSSWPKCAACVQKQAGDGCRFIGLRVFPLDDRTGAAYVRAARFSSRDYDEAERGYAPMFSSEDCPSPCLALPKQRHLNRPMDEAARLQIMRTAASALLDILVAEEVHAQSPACLQRSREIDVRAMCDRCQTALFSASFLCRYCGREYCPECRAALPDQSQADPGMLKVCSPTQHAKAWLMPVTRFRLDELRDTINEMREMLETSRQDACSLKHQPASTPRQVEHISRSQNGDQQVRPASEVGAAQQTAPSSTGGMPCHQITRICKTDLTDVEFERLWSRGEPLVVSGCGTSTRWGPDFFIAHHGTQACEIVRCDVDPPRTAKERQKSKGRKGKWNEVKVGDFFATLGRTRAEKEQMLGPGIWKLKDWPWTGEFRQLFPELYSEFNAAVPAPDYTRRDGCRNISALFPKNVAGPDLGPKMYTAWPGELTKGGQGSTRLHMDVADAVNIMLYTAPPPDGEVPSPSEARVSGSAAWDIFRAEDADQLRAFLRSKYGDAVVDDPIHSQNFYLDESMLAELFRDTGVMPWRIYQRQDEAVFIPAGCAHQVCNLTDCMKVAVDFLSPHNVARCFRLTSEFRNLTGGSATGKSWKEDVLQLRAQLWYAWLACKSIHFDDEVVGAKEGMATVSRIPGESEPVVWMGKGQGAREAPKRVQSDPTHPKLGATTQASSDATHRAQSSVTQKDHHTRARGKRRISNDGKDAHTTTTTTQAAVASSASGGAKRQRRASSRRQNSERLIREEAELVAELQRLPYNIGREWLDLAHATLAWRCPDCQVGIPPALSCDVPLAEVGLGATDGNIRSFATARMRYIAAHYARFCAILHRGRGSRLNTAGQKT